MIELHTSMEAILCPSIMYVISSVWGQVPTALLDQDWKKPVTSRWISRIEGQVQWFSMENLKKFQNISLQNSFNRKAIFLPPPTYVLFIRSLLEQSATVWHSSLWQENIQDLERIQKSTCRIMLQDEYKRYKISFTDFSWKKRKTVLECCTQMH